MEGKQEYRVTKGLKGGQRLEVMFRLRMDVHKVEGRQESGVAYPVVFLVTLYFLVCQDLGDCPAIEAPLQFLIQ